MLLLCVYIYIYIVIRDITLYITILPTILSDRALLAPLVPSLAPRPLPDTPCDSLSYLFVCLFIYIIFPSRLWHYYLLILHLSTHMTYHIPISASITHIFYIWYRLLAPRPLPDAREQKAGAPLPGKQLQLKTNTYIYIYIYVYIHIHIYIYIYIYIYSGGNFG